MLVHLPFWRRQQGEGRCLVAGHNAHGRTQPGDARHLRKKDLFTIDQLSTEMNASKNVSVSVLHHEEFFQWENILDKHFKEAPKVTKEGDGAKEAGIFDENIFCNSIRVFVLSSWS